MTWDKRLFDLVVTVLLIGLLWPVILLVGLALLLIEGRPVFYVAERMSSPQHGFGLIKFRTMRLSGQDSGVTGGDKSGRISGFHRILRRSRADELPQLWNVLRGEISLVGPRPPMRTYVEAFPDLYAQVLVSRPGITGLASLTFHRHEEWLLSRCRTPAEVDSVYRRHCIPRKARLDLIYQRHRTLCLDALIVLRTAKKPFAGRDR